jgi:hypothetical protein
MPGVLADNTYTSPDRTFQIRMPWLSAEGTIRADIIEPGTLIVTIADDLCREFSVRRFSGSLAEQSLESWVEAHIRTDLNSLNVPVDMKRVTTRNGPAISVRYRVPAGFACRRPASGGKQNTTQLDADVGVYLYYHDRLFYELEYVVGLGPEAPRLWYVNRTPVEEILAQFADGFEILTASKNTNPGEAANTER